MSITSNSYTSWFISRVAALSATHAEEQCVLAFMGMSPLQAQLLAKAGGSVTSIVSEDGNYHPEDFQANKRVVFKQCLASDGPVVMLYEQLLEIKGTLSEMYSGKIYVVQNNLFTPTEGYPSPVKDSELSAFADSLNQAGAVTTKLDKYYATAQRCGAGFLVESIKLNDELELEELNLYESADIKATAASPSNKEAIPAASTASLVNRLELSNGVIRPLVIEVSAAGGKINNDGPKGALAGLAERASLPVKFVLKAEVEEDAKDTGLLLPMLRRHWGTEAKFRLLSFYSNPDFSNEMELISQGAVCEFAVKQALNVHENNDSYRDILLTAPTGAGKSILFQLPALYLAQELKTATLVIEPLKALMTDQVANLRKRGVSNVVAINSDIAYEERMRSYEKIKNGEASIIYLSPELLLESSLETILNGRDLGLVVVDEVHTVTSWGKDFRPDYWYLGPYLAKLRKAGTYRFPIFCLTATAVYGGRDDVVNQTIRDLELNNCRLFLGNPRRDNVDFAIRPRSKANFPGPIETVKTDLAVRWIQEAVAANDHAIVYCPYRSQVNAITDVQPCGPRALGYHSGMQKETKKIVSNAFKGGSCRVLISTKAFGMGIDIDDINAVYHYAPTGNLSDYVQEIGRGGRKRGIRSVAAVDFFAQDTRYAEQLYALSRFTQWQLKEIMRKLYEVYASRPRDKRSQNFLVSPNSFSYLFTSEKDEDRKANRVKSGLMMIARDLEERYNFPVLIVRPKMSYTKQYVCIDADAEQRFTADYGKYLKRITEYHTRYEDRVGQNRVAISDLGAIYELNVGEMWSSEFGELTFADFKRRLFTGEICGTKQGVPAVTNRMVLDVAFSMPYDDAADKLTRFADALDATLLELGHGDFTDKEFKAKLSPKLSELAIEINNYKELLNTLVRPIDADRHSDSINVFKCVTRRSRTQEKTRRPQEPTYSVISRGRMAATGGLKQAISKLRPREGQATCRRYLNCKTLGSQYALAEILQVLNLANYTVKGGDNPEIFIRLNDPSKIHSLSLDKSYSNNVLRELNDRHAYSSKVIRGFFTTEMEDSQRWDLIEEYFLGNDEYVAQALGIAEQRENGSAKPKVRHGKTAIERSGVIATMKNEGESTEGAPLFRLWRELINSCSTSAGLQDLLLLKDLTHGARFEAPCKGVTIAIESTGAELHPLLTWKEKRVLLFAPEHADEYVKATDINWKRYLLGQGEGIAALADDIKLSNSHRG